MLAKIRQGARIAGVGTETVGVVNGSVGVVNEGVVTVTVGVGAGSVGVVTVALGTLTAGVVSVALGVVAVATGVDTVKEGAPFPGAFVAPGFAGLPGVCAGGRGPVLPAEGWFCPALEGAPPSSRSRAAVNAGRPLVIAPNWSNAPTSVPFSPGWIGR